MTETQTAGTLPATGGAPIVQMSGITIEFPGVKALVDVDFTLHPGEVHALMGENGAGKSTLIKALTGVHATDAGRITVDGTDVSWSGPAAAQAAGISTVYQEVNLCTNLTVAENILLGREPRRLGSIDGRAMRKRAREVLARIGLTIDPASTLGAHPIAVQQLVAIARAVEVDCRVLILDEPTSSLDTEEVQELFRIIRVLRKQGVAILFVSHFLDQVFEISDRMTVLRNGRLVGEYVAGGTSPIELVSAMIGRELRALEDFERLAVDTDAARQEATPVLSARGLGRAGAIEPFDLDVYAGEVVGLAGLLGSGRTELARLLFGADRPDQGEIAIDGRTVQLRSPRSAIAHGIAFCSEDRKGEGLIGDLTVRDNLVLAMQAARGWTRPIAKRSKDELVATYIGMLDIRPADPDALVRNLSGGNQQKVILARWLLLQPRLLILDEPTRGIDVSAKAQIQRLVAKLATDGIAVLFISAELEEVLRISDRVVVLRDRNKVAERTSDGLEVEDVLDIIASSGESAVDPAAHASHPSFEVTAS